MRLRSRVRLHVLTGFLGSGKSTLLRAYLHAKDHGIRTAVLINEFGAVAIDNALVRSVSPYAQTLTGGCACCTVDRALIEALIAILTQIESGETPKVTDIVLETSGMADPSRIIGTIADEINLAEYLEIANCVTCVEAGTDAAQPKRYPEIGNQIACASRLVLTKTDLTTAAAALATARLLNEMNPLAEIRYATDFRVGSADLFAPSKGPNHSPPLPRTHGSRLKAFQIDLDTRMGWTAFSVWLTALMHRHGDKILRFKGVVPLERTGRALVLQSVRHRVSEPEHLDLASADDGIGFGLVFICDGDFEMRVRLSMQKFQDLVDRMAQPLVLQPVLRSLAQRAHADSPRGHRAH